MAFVSFRRAIMATETSVNVKAGIGGGFNLQTSLNGAGKGGTGRSHRRPGVPRRHDLGPDRRCHVLWAHRVVPRH